MYTSRWCRRAGMSLRYYVRPLLAVVCLTFILVTITGHVPIFNGSVTQFRQFENLQVDIKEIERNAVNKLIIAQQDGSVNIVFQLPASSKLSSILRKATWPLLVSSRNDSGVEVRSDVLEADVKSGNETRRNHENNSTTTGGTSSTTISDKKGVTHRDNHDVVISAKMTNTQASYTLGDRYPLTIGTNPYHIINKNICRGISDLQFVVLVHSATIHFERRNAIRETWASSKLFRNHTMKIVFLLGLTERDSTQALIEHESVLHGDIIQGTFQDTYQNLTHKGVLGLRWLSEYCPETKIIVKIDDDVFLNVFQVMDDVVTTYSQHTREIWCPVRWIGTSQIQRGSGKWKIDESEFFNLTHYPVTYCNGYFVILTADIIPEMYAAAKSTPFFWVDDVYLFGMLVDKVGNVNHTQVSNLNLNENQAIECFDSKEKPCPMLVANAHTDGVMDRLWYNALRQHRDLAKQYVRAELIAQ